MYSPLPSFSFTLSGSPEALRSLLLSNAHQAFLYAISRFSPSEPPATKAAFSRALRALAVACAELVGPSQWGLRDDSSLVRDDAKLALEYFFQVMRCAYQCPPRGPDNFTQLEVLDVYLPLLTDSSAQASMSIAQLLGAALRAPSHRTAVAEWVPPAERGKDASRGRRRWERPEAIASAHTGGGGWVARHLTTLLRSRDVKAQEAALNALAALAKDNNDVAVHLARAPAGRPSSGAIFPSHRFYGLPNL
jgi:armadillo repeat-containing protein 8